MKCPSCGTANPDDSRFCNACGSRLDQTAGGDAALDPFLPRDLLAKLEAARAGRAMEGERRVVTMLFCDVKGSTAMAETLDPEDWAEVMNGAFQRLIAPIYRYEGTLARLMGDAIFAFFGAPIAHEDDPQRAVWAGLDIVSGIAAYKEQVKAERGLDLDVRVGVNTGPVMVGQVGSDLRLEYTAMGDAVNVAARMEQAAEPGTVQITAETHRLVEPLFDLESRGSIEVKGKADPVEAFRVLGRRAEPGPTRGMRGSPLVGRDREMEQLHTAIEEALSGGGRIVSLVGEAGLGKSRLVEETRAEWTRRRPEDPQHGDIEIHRIWETWQCVSYDATRPYSQYRRMVAQIAGIEDTDAPDVVRTKLAGTIEYGSEDWLEPHMRVWRSLFGVTEPGEEPLEGEAFRDAITELVTSSTRAFSARRAAAPGFRGPALVRRGLDGRPDRDRQARRRSPVPVPVRLPSRPPGAVVAPEAMARDRVPAPVDRARARSAVRRRERTPDRGARPERGSGRPNADPRAHRRQPTVRGGGRRGRPRARRRSRSRTRFRRCSPHASMRSTRRPSTRCSRPR